MSYTLHGVNNEHSLHTALPDDGHLSWISQHQGSMLQSKSPSSRSVNYPPLDYAVTAKTHFDELYKYLASYLAKGAFQASARFVVRVLLEVFNPVAMASPTPPGLPLRQ